MDERKGGRLPFDEEVPSGTSRPRRSLLDPSAAPGAGEAPPEDDASATESAEPYPFPVAAVALLLLLVLIMGYVGMRVLIGGPPRPAPSAAAGSVRPEPGGHADPVADLLSTGEETHEPRSPAAMPGARQAGTGRTRASAAGSPASGQDPLLLARAGEFALASEAWARRLASGPSRDGWTVQLSANCEPGLIQDLLTAPGLGRDAFLLPVAIRGQSCYRVCSGVYPGRAEADRRAREISIRPPAAGVVARAVLLADLLPRSGSAAPTSR